MLESTNTHIIGFYAEFFRKSDIFTIIHPFDTGGTFWFTFCINDLLGNVPMNSMCLAHINVMAQAGIPLDADKKQYVTITSSGG